MWECLFALPATWQRFGQAGACSRRGFFSNRLPTGLQSANRVSHPQARVGSVALHKGLVVLCAATSTGPVGVVCFAPAALRAHVSGWGFAPRGLQPACKCDSLTELPCQVWGSVRCATQGLLQRLQGPGSSDTRCATAAACAAWRVGHTVARGLGAGRPAGARSLVLFGACLFKAGIGNSMIWHCSCALFTPRWWQFGGGPTYCLQPAAPEPATATNRQRLPSGATSEDQCCIHILGLMSLSDCKSHLGTPTPTEAGFQQSCQLEATKQW